MKKKKTNKNYSEKVKVGEFKTPAEIIRDMINSGKVRPLEKGGALQIMNTLAPLGNLIAPGVGTALGAVTSLASQDNTPDQLYGLNQQMRGGGALNGFKQYNAPQHEHGGQMVNQDGVPSNVNPIAEIEGTENSYSYSRLPDKAGSNYVFSDANKTSDMIKDIMSKYKNKDTEKDFATKAAMEMEVKNVENINENLNAKQAVQDLLNMRYGSKTKYETGGPLAKLPNPYDPTQGMGVTQFVKKGGQHIPQRFATASDIPTTVSPRDNDSAFNINTPTPTNNSNMFSNIQGDDILRTAGLVAGGIDALQKPQEDELIMPDYSESDERFNAMNANLEQARQDVMGASNRASELNRGASSSYSQFRGRELSNIGNLQDSLAGIGLQEQQLRNQILGQQGQYEANKANVERGIKQEQQIANLQNKARSQDIKRQFFSDVVAEADRLGTARDIRNISAAKIEEGKALLNMVAPDFDVNNDMVTNLIKVSKGQMDPKELSDDELIVFTRLNQK